MFWSRKKRQDRSHKIVIKKEQMAKLATMCEAFGHKNTNETVSRLIDGFFSDPLGPTGRHVGQVMSVGEQNIRQQVTNENPLMQIFNQLPPELQKAVMEKAVGYIAGSGNKGLSTGF